jgi:hypothetical protein
MCAAVASMPEVITLPLTDLSDEITKVALPDADVFTGGISWSPDNVTLMPCGLEPFVAAQPTTMSSTKAKIIDDGPNFCTTLFMNAPFKS